MKSVLISIQPKWCELIANGKKTIEVRKSRPKQDTPFPCYIYETKAKGGCGKVIGEFMCDKLYLIKNQGSRFSVADEEQSVTNEIARKSCLYYDDMVSYLSNKDGYGWHISDLVIYDKPKELSEFFTPMGKRPSYMIERPPQSWCYVEWEAEKGGEK